MPKSNLSTHLLTTKQIRKIQEYAERERLNNRRAAHADDDEDDDDDNEVEVVTRKKVIPVKRNAGIGPPATPRKKNGKSTSHSFNLIL